jgi:hypothetical protein
MFGSYYVGLLEESQLPKYLDDGSGFSSIANQKVK